MLGSRTPRSPLGLAGTLAVCALVSLWPALRQTPAEATDGGEVRAVWVLRDTLSTLESIESAVLTAQEAGFNTLFVQVRARGDAMFAGGLEPRGFVTGATTADFDPLAAVLDHATAAGLRVHAWINVNLVSSAARLPLSRDHIAYRHPEWLMVPRALARELATVDPQNPTYVNKLARWTRGHPSAIEGLYASPLHEAAIEHTVAVVSDVAARYALDGVHLDYLRYPSDEFDYSAGALAAFTTEMIRDLPPERRVQLDARAVDDPLAYPDALPEAWTRFRRSRLTTLLMRLRTALERVRPELTLSAAVVADMADAHEQRLQDWSTWLEAGLLDAAIPLAYTTDPVTFVSQIAAARRVPGVHELWAGIGAYRLTVPQTLEHIFAARREGVDGVALFSYDSLAPDTHDQPDYLLQVGRSAFRPVGQLPGGGE